MRRLGPTPVLVAILTVGAGALRAPVPLLTRELPRLSRGEVRAETISGGLFRGFRVTGLRVTRPGLVVEIPRAEIRLGWPDLRERRIVVRELSLFHPRVRLVPRPAARPRVGVEGPRAQKDWSLDLRRGRILGGSLEWRGRRLEGIDAQASAWGGTWAARARLVRPIKGRFEGAMTGDIWRARGRLDGLGGAADLGEVSSRFEAAGKGQDAAGRFRLAASRGLRASGELSVVAGRPSWSARLNWPRGAWRTLSWSGADAVASGQGSRLEAAGTARGVRIGARHGIDRVSWAGEAREEGRSWRARVSRFSAALGGRVVRAERPFALSAVGGRGALRGFSLTDGAGRASVEASWRGGSLDFLRARLDRFDSRPWSRAGAWPLSIDGVFDGELEASGRPRAMEGSLHASVDSASLRGLPVGRLEAEASADGETLELDLLTWRPGRGVATARGTLPWIVAGERTLDVRVEAKELGAPALEGPLGLSEAAFDGSFRALGPLAAPRVSGRGAFRARRLETASGKIENFSAAFEGAERGIRIVVPPMAFSSALGAKGTAAADLWLSGPWSAPVVTGTVTVARLEYSPPRGKGPSAGAPAARAERKPGKTVPMAVDVRLRCDGDAWFRDKNGAVEAKADLRLKKEPQGPPRLFGTVETVRGNYAYLGRSFDVFQGRLRFLGEAPPDPALEGLARHVDGPTRTKVYLHAAGTLHRPKLTFTSEPPLDEKDILSFLAFGKPLYEVGHGSGRATEQAAALIAGYVSREVGQFLPLDIFQVQMSGDRQADVTLGRYLTRKLFVSYGQTVGTRGEQKIDTQYIFSPHWSLETSNSREGHTIIDFLFNYGVR